MNASIVELLSHIPNVLVLKGCLPSETKAAEKDLGLVFSDEFRTYTETFGAVSIAGKQITGVVPYPDMNVVTVTKSAKGLFPDTPKSWYVIYDSHINDLIHWQDADGRIYQTLPESDPTLIANSLYEYLSL